MGVVVFLSSNKSTENLAQNFKGLLCFVSQFLQCLSSKPVRKQKPPEDVWWMKQLVTYALKDPGDLKMECKGTVS